MSGRLKSTQEARHRPSSEKAYMYLRQQIADGSLGAGRGISELQLARELGSSRGPVREAMVQLATQGILVRSLDGGMVVAELTKEDIVELYETWEALERYAIGKIARVAISSADKERLQHSVDEIARLEQQLFYSGEDALDSQQMECFIKSDLAFHRSLISMARNSRLLKVIDETRWLISIFAIHRGGPDRGALSRIRENRQQMLDAVIRKDCASATSYVVEHIEASRRERLIRRDIWQRETALSNGMVSSFRHSLQYSQNPQAGCEVCP